MVTLIERTTQQPVSTQLRAGAVAHLIAEHLGDLIHRADAQLTRDRFTNETFTKHEPYLLRSHEEFRDTLQRVHGELESFANDFPDQEPLVNAFAAVLNQARQEGSGLEVLGRFYRTALEIYRDRFEPTSATPRAQVSITEEGLSAWINLTDPVQASGDQRFLAAASQLLELRRATGEFLTPDERIAVRAAYWLIDQGVHVPTRYPIWGTSGFRDVQTYASITDPGEGHLAGTVLRQEHLRGVIVHVEHLERGVDRSREELEPYRIPSPRTVARVRLHVGSAAPTSSYIGRPLFDGTVEDSLLKTSRTFAAAASSLLADGLAEVKFAVERMSASEAVTLLSSLANEVRRDRYAQVLSAAFNINTPLLDDRPETVSTEGAPRWARTQQEIGLLGVQIAAAAGFDKVTWDGTADSYPSRCITDQLSKPVAVELVHRAHEAGLLTYFSAGFRFDNIPDAVTTGVDGIGIGGAQILRYMDKKTGNHGPFLPGNIERILAVRDEAAGSVLGRGAHLLARLDRLYYESTLATVDNPLREALFRALQDANESAVRQVIDSLPHIIARSHDSQQPLFAWAGRLLAGGDLLAKERIHPDSWEPLLAMLRNSLNRNDASALAGHLRTISA